MIKTQFANGFLQLEDIDGSFDVLSHADQQLVHLNGGGFYYRNGAPNADGSMGTVSLSPQQLRDLVAYLLMAGGIIKPKLYATPQHQNSDVV